MKHIWRCSCGKETECHPDDLKLGAVWHCDSCNTSFGCVGPKAGGKAWVEINPRDVAFHKLFEDVEEDC